MSREKLPTRSNRTERGSDAVLSAGGASAQTVDEDVAWEGGKSSSKMSSFTPPLVSPDDTVVAFEMLRSWAGGPAPPWCVSPPPAGLTPRS
jgi:hypothetical protein